MQTVSDFEHLGRIVTDNVKSQNYQRTKKANNVFYTLNKNILDKEETDQYNAMVALFII